MGIFEGVVKRAEAFVLKEKEGMGNHIPATEYNPPFIIPDSLPFNYVQL